MADKRLRRVESLLKEEIGYMIARNEIKDPRVDPLLTITDLTVSRDLKYAKVYISYYGKKAIWDQQVIALNHAGGFIRSILGRRLRLKNIPQLNFRADHSIERGFRITQKIRDMNL